MTNNRHNTYNTLFHWNSFRLKLVFEGMGIGIITGFLVVLYRVMLEKAGLMLTQIYHHLVLKPMLTLLWIGALIIIGYVVGLLLKTNL
jgi:H+/Cl- antiporter ClcA